VKKAVAQTPEYIESLPAVGEIVSKLRTLIRKNLPEGIQKRSDGG
jgi:hypothetical protein